MTGTDPVWSVARGQSLDQADEDWDHYDQLIEFHRHWLQQLPPEVEVKIRMTNAKLLLTGNKGVHKDSTRKIKL